MLNSMPLFLDNLRQEYNAIIEAQIEILTFGREDDWEVVKKLSLILTSIYVSPDFG